MRKRLVLLFIVLFSLQPVPAFADGVAEVQEIVDRNIKVVIDYVKNKDLDKETRNKKIIDTVSPFFDFDFMAKICLGKKYWMQLDPAGRKKFTDLFVERLQESFLEKLDLYTDEKVIVEDAKRVKNRIHVLTYLVSKGDKMDMKFKFWKTREGWKVYDLEILGASMVVTYRSQFSGFLKENSLDDLLKKLSESGSFGVPTGENGEKK